jgi:hypothetical protein
VWLAVVDGAAGWGVAWPVLILVGVVLLLSVVYWVVTTFAWILRFSRRRPSPTWLLFVIGALIGAWPSLAMTVVAKPLAARIVAGKTRPVIDAIEAFQAEHGALPESLEQLVPTYLPGPVRTGSPAYPSIRYLRGEDPNGPWGLEVPMTELMGFDTLNYCLIASCDDLMEEGEVVASTAKGRWIFILE